MQKLTELVEKYVEWVALAIGGLFLAAMVFLYLINTPVSGKIGERTVTLGSVENETYTKVGSALEGAMLNKDTPKVSIPAYQKQFADYAAAKNVAEPKLAFVPWFGGGAPSQELKQGPAVKSSDSPVASKLPKLPTADWYKVSQGKSNVQDNPNAPVVQPVAMAPATPGNPATGANAAPQGVDKIWVTEAFTIPQDDLQKAFTEAGIAAGSETTALRVELVRQEQLANGQWGNETTIKPLPIHNVPDFPAAGNLQQANQYLAWAVSNSTTILTPSFYPQLAGDHWYAPGQDNPNKPVEVKPVVNPTNPQMPPGMGAPGMMPGQMPGMPRQRSSRSNRSSRGMGGSGMRAPEDGQRPTSAGPRYGGMPPMMGGMPPGGMPPEAYEAMMRAQQGGMPGMMPGMPYGPGGMGVPTNAIPQGNVVPSAPFAVSTLTGDIFTWVHDDTVEPGKTYRYKMRYMLKNPLFGRSQAVQNPADARQFALTSDFTDWTDPVVVAPITQFFVSAGVGPGASSVRFDVFRWQLGEWHLKSFLASAGDMIGLPDKNIDYQTGFTLVDTNSGMIGGTPHVVVSDAGGQLVARTFRDDQGDEQLFKKSISWQDPNAPKTTVPGMPPGMGPMGMPGEMMGPMGPMGMPGMPPGMGPTGPSRRPTR